MKESIDYRNVFKDAEAYDTLTRSKHVRLIYELEKQVLQKLFEQIRSAQKSVMDFACGTGRWTRVLEGNFKETLAVDVSAQMVAAAREKCSKAEFIVTDITSDNVDSRLCHRKFDVVTAFRFYKNAEEPLRRTVTEAIPKYLKDDGLFIFDLHLNTFSFMGILAVAIRSLKLYRPLGLTNLTVRTISLHAIRKLFKNSPLDIIDYYGMGLLPGRSNFTVLPAKPLYKLESFLTNRKILRNISYNIIVVAEKKRNANSDGQA